MTPAQAIAQLDRKIAGNGQGVTLRRVVANAPAVEKPARAFVRGYRPSELVGGILQGDYLVILSPTSLPAEFANPLPRSPDKLKFDGLTLNIQYIEPVRLNGVLVRLNITARG